MDLTAIVDRLLEMKPDPIPHFVLLKEFKGCTPNSTDYQNAYDRVCDHPFVKRFTESQNEKGFWPSYHSYTEWVIRCLLSYGLDKSHSSLKRVIDYSVRLLKGEEEHDRNEKQDNIRWWPELFMPLVLAATISLLDNMNENLTVHRSRWANFAEIAFSGGNYDEEADRKAQIEYFGFKTKGTINPFNYYHCLLLPSRDGISHLSEDADQALVDYGMNEANCLCYIYNNNPGDLVSINALNRDSRDFCHWIRALSLVSQFNGWQKYQQEHYTWVLEQRNQDGVWEFPKKFDHFVLSNSWRGRNRAIDSTIYVLRFLMKKLAF